MLFGLILLAAAVIRADVTNNRVIGRPEIECGRQSMLVSIYPFTVTLAVRRAN